ncbi:tetratricopeptide repeat protein [Salinihabitans flavidus]|uniref:tetratricopeptide repeat protein n=1 Tax=Salinihabitans flavidus TaxID=569882 RepID=UPI001FDF3A78|nr:tetratricopeptide repeat protein [Salinihabitans flavidus]
MAQGLAGPYLAGRQAVIASDYRAAAEYYTRALARDPSNPILLDNALLSHMSLGQFEKAVPIARKMESDELDSQIAHMAVTASLIAEGDYDAVLARMKPEFGTGPLVDGLVAAWAQIGSGNMSGALEAFDEVAEQRGLAGFAAYHKALALASVGDFEGAEEIYASDQAGAIQMTRRGAMARFEVLSQLDRNEDAVAMLDDTFGGGLDPALRDMRERLVAGEMLPFTHVRSARDGMAEVFYSVAGALQAEAEPNYTLVYTRVAEYLRPDHVDALLLSANLLEQLERHELATAAYRRVPADHPAFHAAELGRAEALRRSDRPDAAVEVLEQLARTHGDIPTVHSSLGDLMRQEKDFAAAVAAYDRALEKSDEEDNNRWFIFYARGISHERLDQWEQAEADFRAALELNPGQPLVLNYLGYSMVEKQIKLDEALAMIEEAVAARPDSGFIVDSLGWVLYRLGRYPEAVGHMEHAAELLPTDPVVNDHLGDVYWAVGRKLEAEFQWRRALSFVDEDSAEEAKPDRIRRKLEVGLDRVLEEEGEPPLLLVNGN